MSKSEAILRHRNYLIGRLLPRNPMLHFKPSERSGRIVDFYDLPDVPTDADVSTNINKFFRTLIEDKRVEISLPNNSIPGRLRRLKTEADDQHRATGLPSCFLAWPFINIPDENNLPKVAPLFFWQIDITIQRQILTISITEAIKHKIGITESAKHNFMLEKWLELKRHISLPLSSISGDNGESTEDDLYDLSQKINDMFNELNEQLNVRNDISEENPYTLHKYSSSNELTIMPCAALGIVNFKYLTLLHDLEELSERVKGGSCGLLDEFFDTPSKNVINSPKGEEPEKESEKYLIELTDSSQESAIWQARKSPIMLLDGPPGTGKSQTIVNLIADALARKESVALVCHQPAALNVVKKRLDAGEENIGVFCKKIIDPRKQRSQIIKDIRAIANGDDNYFPNIEDVNQSEKLGNTIRKLESLLEKIIKSCGTDDKYGYSMCGDFRGIIEEISNTPNYSNLHFNVFNPKHEPFINTIGKIDVDLQKCIEELRQYASDYIGCKFDTNPWKDAEQNDDTIQFDLESLTEDASELDKSNNLPKKELLPILFNNIAANHAHVFFDNESRTTIKDFAQLIKSTRNTFHKAKIPTPPIWENIYNKAGGKKYAFYASQSRHLSTILSVKERQAKNKLIATFMQNRDKFGTTIEDMEHWQNILKSVYYYLKFSKIPRPIDLQNQLNNCKNLKEFLKKKRTLDSQVIGHNFRFRRQFSNYLLKQGFLKLKGVGGKKATTIRDICHHGKRDLNEIFPALLMNPDSMCQILPLEPNSIDLVIIDEASQMFVADALPILYRAKKIIISGDNMQMPPGDTFAMKISADGDDETDGEYQQQPTPEIPIDHIELLNAAKAVLPYDNHARCELSIHYRSRPAELIAFSNHAFYKGKLQTAPDNNFLLPPLDRPIQVIHAAGTFNTGINDKEIEEIISSLKNIWLGNHNPPSVGVIVFNTTQAKKLRLRLDEESELCSDFQCAYQQALSMEVEGEDVSFFVRSVEHVQGDERDIIILGTTYNTTGRYGPLNTTDKGRKRLNVAVTRAKYGMYVITSLDIDMISNAGEQPTDNAGSERWFLWKFMKYARAISTRDLESAANILRSLNPTYTPSRPVGRTPDSQFEKDVGDFIQGIGYTVDYQIGEGGFRIDLGVKSPQNDKRYLCGIECDGRYWHSGWRARHNDIWRQEILEGKGWTIHRIWSDHWYSINADDTKNELCEKLYNLSQTLL